MSIEGGEKTVLTGKAQKKNLTRRKPVCGNAKVRVFEVPGKIVI